MITLYSVVGFARSGTTLSGRRIADAISAPCLDELFMVWRRGVIEDRMCTCGLTFSRCDHWSSIRLAAPGAISAKTAAMASRVVERLALPRSAALTLTSPGRTRVESSAPEAFKDACGELISAIAGAYGVDRLVDSSKAPGVALVAGSIPGLTVRPWHVVRDPRAVSWSWSHPPDVPQGWAELPRTSPTRAASAWVLFNLASEAVGRHLGNYQRVRFEDLRIETDDALARRVGGGGGARAEAGSTFVVHSLAGNPGVRSDVRRFSFETGELWRTQPRGQFALTSAISLPLLRRYGYSWTVK